MKFWKILFFITLCLLFSSATLLSWQDKKQKFLDFLREYLNLNDIQSASNQDQNGVEPIIFKPIPIHFIHQIPVPVENFPIIDHFQRHLSVPIEISHEFEIQRDQERPTASSQSSSLSSSSQSSQASLSSSSSSSRPKSRKHRKLSKHHHYHHNQNQYSGSPSPPPSSSSSSSTSSSSIPFPLQCNLKGFQIYDIM